MKQNLLILFILFLAACGAEQDLPLSPPTATSTVIETLVSATPMLTNTPILSPAILARTLVADSEYMRDCKAINSSHQEGQLDYHRVLPGKSTNEDVLNLMNKPTENNYFHETIEMVYRGFNVYIENDVVDSIYVYEDPHLLVSLERLILEYGCPDLIYAIDSSIDQPGGNYSVTELIYLNNGIEFLFSSFPVSLTETPYMIDFFKPQPLEKYLIRSNFINEGIENSKPMLWDEAVR